MTGSSRAIDRDRREAFHGAGHVVAAIDKRFGFDSVTVEPNQDSFGKMLLKRWNERPAPDYRSGGVIVLFFANNKDHFP